MTPRPHPEAPRNAAPAVIPALQRWRGGTGTLRLGPAARLVVPATLLALGHDVAADLTELAGLTLPVTSGDGAPGDLLLRLEPGAPDGPDGPDGQRYREEGYRLDVTASGLTLTAPTATGLFYGSRTLLQMLLLAPDRATLPQGSAVDWPDYPSRGFVLDVGRRFFPAAVIRDYIRLLSYFKLNRFHLHLNDNEIFRPDDQDWRNGYHGFRLRSENPVFAGLASADGAYSRAEWDEFEALAAARGVQLVAEIDAPAHAAAIIAWRPELGLDGGKSDHLDLGNPASFTAMRDIFSEFNPWFRGPEVHFGADEYPAERTDEFRAYYNAMAAHLRSLGKQPAAWGSFQIMGGGAAGYDREVTIDAWNPGWYGLPAAVADGFRVRNVHDAQLYVVPFADYYHGQGLDHEALFSDWLPHQAGDAAVAPGHCDGALFALWNDRVDVPYTPQDAHRLIERSFPVLAQKTWRARVPEGSYAQFGAACQRLGLGPGVRTLLFDGGS